MRITATAAFAAAAACMSGCSERAGPPAPALVNVSHGVYTEQLEVGDIERRLVDHAWVDAADDVLDKPTVVELPYAEWGGFLGSEPGARGFAFSGAEGQVVKVALARPDANDAAVVVDGNIRVELFLAQARSGDVEHVRLAEIPAGESALWFRLPAAASYVVRLQPEPLTDALYRLSLELEAALPFPVKGKKDDAVASMFGMPRDAGTRHHEGIDIFAPRSTPVLAVAEGRATPRENKLGGNTVWISTPGVSYYYAHLERAAVKPGQRVRVGEVIGYVGNTGNAVTTDPHLHFGIYRWGKGAVDPFPLLQARRFSEPPTGISETQLMQAALRRGGCAGGAGGAARTINVAAFGCAMRIGKAVEGLTAATALSCMPSAASPITTVAANAEPSSGQAFAWEAAAPLSIDEQSTVIVPVDLDPASAMAERASVARSDSLFACELASTAGAAPSAPPSPLPVHAAARHARGVAF
jgi:murein DD-endopeptidase MepM/ murein hydrolase activator NlpD